MKNTIKNIMITATLVLAMVVCLVFSVAASEAPATVTGEVSGTIAWSYDVATGTLTITPASDAAASDAAVCDYGNCSELKADVLTAYKTELKAVVIKNSSTVTYKTLSGNLRNFPALESITFPSTIQWLADNNRNFDSNPKLDTFGPEGTEKGTCDLRGISFKSWFQYSTAGGKGMFEGDAFVKAYLSNKWISSDYRKIGPRIFANNTKLEYLNLGQQVGNWSDDGEFAGCTNLKIVEVATDGRYFSLVAPMTDGFFGNATIYTFSAATSWVNWLKEAKNADGQPYNAKFDVGTFGNVEYEYDMKADTFYVQLVEGDTTGVMSLGGWNSAWETALKGTGASIIEYRNVEGRPDVTAINGTMKGDAPNATKVIVPDTVSKIGGRPTGYGFNVLNTFGKKSTVTDGVIDFTGITYGTAYDMQKSFRGGTFEKVIISDGNSAIGVEMFANNTALKEVIVPASVTSIESKAFDGCTNEELTIYIYAAETEITIADDAIPSTATVIFVEAPDASTEILGFAIRTKDYAGLRGVFTIDLAAERAGYKLVEFGTVLGSAEKFASVVALTPASTGAVVKTMWTEQRGWLGSVLAFEEGVSATFACTVTYSEEEIVTNGNKDLYMRAYQVWEDENTGTLFYVYSDYESGKAVSLATTATVAYFANPAKYEDVAAWNVILEHKVTEFAAVSGVDATWYLVNAGTKVVCVYRGTGMINFPAFKTYDEILMIGVGGEIDYNAEYFEMAGITAPVKVVNPEVVEVVPPVEDAPVEEVPAA